MTQLFPDNGPDLRASKRRSSSFADAVFKSMARCDLQPEKQSREAVRVSVQDTVAQREPGLRARPGAENENIHQSFCALRPVWPRRHVGNADQSSEQVEWIEVRADVAAFDRSLHQCIDSSFNLNTRCLKELRRSPNNLV